MAGRQADVADVPAMADARTDDTDSGPADPRMAAYLRGEHHPREARAPRAAFVAESGRRVVGYIAGHLTHRFGCEGEVQYLYVAPGWRRRGVAALLLGALAGWFVERRARRVCVDVLPDNSGARSLYARHGAVELSEHWMVREDIARSRDAMERMEPTWSG